MQGKLETWEANFHHNGEIKILTISDKKGEKQA